MTMIRGSATRVVADATRMSGGEVENDFRESACSKVADAGVSLPWLPKPRPRFGVFDVASPRCVSCVMLART